MYILNQSTRLHWVVMMIENNKLLTELQDIHMEQMILKYVKVRYEVNINDYFWWFTKWK